MTRPTVTKHIKRLIKDGFVIDYTPKVRHAPHRLGVKNLYTLGVKEFDTRCKESLLKDSLYLPQDVEPGGVETITPFQELYTEFMNSTKLTNFGNNPKWIKAINQMVEAEITVDDLREGIAYMQREGHTITGPWSVQTPASVAKSKRSQQPVKPKSPVASEVY